MLNKINHNQKGITLVELLAAIVILGLVTTIASVMIVRSLDSKDVAQDNISLKQDTNVLITDLRRQFHEDDGNDKICFNHEANGLVVDDKTEVFSLGETREKIPISNDCITIGDNKTSLEINLVTTNKSEKPLEIKTTFISNSGSGSGEASIPIEGGVCIIAPPGPEPKPAIPPSPEKKPDSKPNDQKDGLTLYHEVKELPCNSEKLREELNIERAAKKQPGIEILDIGWDAERIQNNCPGNKHLIKNNLIIYNQLDDHTNLDLQVDGSLYTKQIKTSGESTFNIVGNFYTEQMDTFGISKFIVGGDIQTKQLKTQGTTTFNAGGTINTEQMDTEGITNFYADSDIFTKQLETKGTTEFITKGNMVTKQLKTNGKNIFTVGKNLYTKQTDTHGTNTFKIGGDFQTEHFTTNGSGPDTFDIGGNLYTDQFKIKGKNTFTVKKSAIFNGQLDMEEGENELIIRGSAEARKQIDIKGSKNNMQVGNCMNFVKASLDLDNSSTLNIDGDVRFDEQVKIDNKSTLTLGHHAIFKKQVKLDVGSSLVIGNAQTGGDAYFKDQFDLSSNSTLTVWGNTDFGSGKNIKLNGTLCSGGKITPSEYADKVTCKP